MREVLIGVGIVAYLAVGICVILAVRSQELFSNRAGDEVLVGVTVLVCWALWPVVVLLAILFFLGNWAGGD